MEQATALSLMREVLLLAILVPGPVLLAGLVVGVLVSLFQAVTQIHEMTLVFIPKILVTVAVLWVAGGWMLSLCVGFAQRLLTLIPMVAR